MFGDIGHGFLLFIVGCYFCLWKDKIEKQGGIAKHMLPARYLITLMGFFATFSGLIYNDFLSISLNFFGSCFEFGEENGDMK